MSKDATYTDYIALYNAIRRATIESGLSLERVALCLDVLRDDLKKAISRRNAKLTMDDVTAFLPERKPDE